MSFGAAWESTFRELTSRSNARVMSDPSVLITRPAISSPARRIQSHSGEEVEPVSILAPTPNLHSAAIDWDRLAHRYTEELLITLEDRGFKGMGSDLAVARVDTPNSWARQGHGAGTPFALAHSFGQTGPFRPRNLGPYAPENVVLAGSFTTPGVGVPTAMLSGALAARRITGGGVR